MTRLSTDSQAEIGILGTGRMGVRLAIMLARAGRRVLLASRDHKRAERIVAGLPVAGVTAGTYEQALRPGIVLPAAFIRDGLFDLLESYRSALSGKIVVDITNPFNDDYSDFILPWDTSGAEEMQKLLPHARIVGAFKNVWWEVFDAPHFAEHVSDVLVVSDDAQAKQAVFDLVAGTPFRYIDAGVLKNARTVERLTLLTGELGLRYHYHPRVNWRLLGEPWKPGSADRDGIGTLIARS